MKRQTRIGLGIAAAMTGAALYPCFASAQIATPVVAAVPNASPDIPFELFRGSRDGLGGRFWNGAEARFYLAQRDFNLQQQLYKTRVGKLFVHLRGGE